MGILVEMVEKAETPEDLATALKVAAQTYLEWAEQADQALAGKDSAKVAIMLALDKLQVDKFDWGNPGAPAVRVTKYKIVKVRPDVKLLHLLQARGLGHLVRTKVTLDDEGLFDAVRKNLIGIEEIRTHSEIRTTEALRVTQVAVKPEGEGVGPTAGEEDSGVPESRS